MVVIYVVKTFLFFKVSKLREFTGGCWSHASESTIISSRDAASCRRSYFIVDRVWLSSVEKFGVTHSATKYITSRFKN